jgi:flavodoxin
MKKTLVAYFSQTGNTQAVAEAIFGALQGEKDIKPIDEALSFEDYGLVFVGFPVQSHSVPYKAETFLRRVPAGKALALFCTHGSLPGHRLSREALEYALVCAAKAKLLGTFACRGKLSMNGPTWPRRPPRIPTIKTFTKRASSPGRSGRSISTARTDPALRRPTQHPLRRSPS